MSLRILLYLVLLLAIEWKGIVSMERLTIPFKILVCTVTLTFVSETLARISAQRLGNSCPVYHVFAVLEFTGYGLVYYFMLKKPLLKKITLVCLLAVPPLEIFNAVFFEHLYLFPSFTIVLTHGLLMVLSLLLFLEMRDYDYRINIVKTGVFWFNTAVLLYCSAVFIILGPYNQFIKRKIDNGMITLLLYILAILFYSLLGLSVFIGSHKKNLSDHERSGN